MAKIVVVDSKINVDMAKAHLEAVKVTPKNETPKGLSDAISTYYKKNTEASKLSVCDVCGTVSSIDLDVCPGCGTGDDQAGDAIEDETDAPENASDDGPEEAGDDAPEGEGEKKEGDSESTPKKRGRKPSAAIVEVLPEGVTVDALDSAVAEVNNLKGATAFSYWKLGEKLSEIHASHLWKARRGDDGVKAKYRTFDQFVKEECGISNVHAYSLIDISKRFTEADVRKLGTSKLTLVLRAPEEKQPEILAAAESGASKRELEEKVKEANATAKAEGRDVTAEKAEKTGRTPRGTGGGREKQSLTISSLLGKKQINLFRKPGKGESATTPARSLEDLPVGVLDLENGVVLAVQVVKGPSGDLLLKCDFKKADLPSTSTNPGTTKPGFTNAALPPLQGVLSFEAS